MENGTVSSSNLCTGSLAKPLRATGLSLSRGGAWPAFVSLRPVVLDLGV